MILTLTVDDSQWTALQRQQPLEYLLADALYEFQSHRRGSYAEDKYRALYPSEAQVQAKVEQVRARCRIAEDLRTAVLLGLQITPTAACPCAQAAATHRRADTGQLLCRECTATARELGHAVESITP